MAGLVPAIHVFRLSKRHAGGPDYLFLPTDAKLEGRSWDQSTVVNWEALQGAIETSKGRRIMLVDTCHSGNAFNARLLKDAADASIAVYAATDAETLAQGRSALGHGVFTYAVIEGLKGGADLSRDRFIEAQELSTYVLGAVRKLTADKQLPTLHPIRTLGFRHLQGPLTGRLSAPGEG